MVGMPRVAALQEAIAGEGGKVVFLLRLSPLIPFALSNYFYGERAVGTSPVLLAFHTIHSETLMRTRRTASKLTRPAGPDVACLCNSTARSNRSGAACQARGLTQRLGADLGRQ